MGQLDRVSNQVQQRVSTIMQMGGSKKKIDTEAEYSALQSLSQELSQTGNKAEKDYVTGLMVEYEKAAAKAQEQQRQNAVSAGARKDIKEIKNMKPNKGEINETKAHMILDLIKNSRGDYNEAEIEYFKQELIKAGFGELLNENTETGTSVKSAPDEDFIPPVMPPVESEPQETEPVQEENDLSKPAEPKPADPKPAEPKPAEPKPAEPDDKEPSKPVSPSKPKRKPSIPTPAKPKTPEPKKPEPKTPEVPAPPKAKPKTLTQSEKMEANNAGYQVARNLAGWTDNDEQALIVDYTTHRLNSKNFVEFMKGYAQGAKERGADSFFEQVTTERDFRDKYNIADATARKMVQYLREHPSATSNRDIKIIEGILAQNNYNSANVKELDRILAKLMR